jgi:hypothetical protein
MEMPAGSAATLDRLAAVVDPRASIAPGMPDRHGGSEAYRPPRSADVVVSPKSPRGLRA